MTSPSAAVDNSSWRSRNSRCSCFAPAPGLDKHCGCRIGHLGHATWAYSCISPPSRSRRRTRSWDGNVGGWSGAAWFSVRCGRWSLKCATYSASTVSRWRRLRISIRSSSSRRTVPIQRSAIAFARDARTGVRRTRMASLANTASKTPVNLLSRSRIKNLNGGLKWWARHRLDLGPSRGLTSSFAGRPGACPMRGPAYEPSPQVKPVSR
jgi:hypothetical protein